MVQTMAARELDLVQLEEMFGLQVSNEEAFFSEWQGSLPELDEITIHRLNEAKADYLYLSRHNLQEAVVKMVVLAPILKSAGFYQSPFHIMAEQKVELMDQDDQTLVRGLVDLMVFHSRLLIVAIEAKGIQYSLEVAIPQTLLYMMSQLETTGSVFGLITNGREFQFLKLVKQEHPIYGLSHTFSLNRGDDLQQVVQILRHLAQVVTQGG